MENSGFFEKKKKRLSYADQVYDFISDQILSGQLQQGEKIVEEKIAVDFGVSRTPIREALTRLKADGLVYLQPRSFAEVVTIDAGQANDIAQLRLKLEQMAFRLLCKRADSEIIQKLEKIAEIAKISLQNNNRAGYFKADSLFHLTASEYSGNKELAAVCRQFDGKVQLLRIAQHCSEERLEIYMKQHFDILQLIKDKQFNSIDEILNIHIMHDLVSSEILI